MLGQANTTPNLVCVQHPSNAPLQTSPHPPGTAPHCHPPSVTFPRGAVQTHGPVLPSGAPAGLHLTRNLKPRETGGGCRQRAKTRTQRATSTYLVRAETRLQDGDGAASPPGYLTRVPTGEVPAAPTFLPVFPCGQLEMGFITPAHSTQRSAGQCRRARHCSHPAGASPPTFRRVVCNGRGKVRKNLNAPKSSVTPGLGQALGGRRQDCFQRGFWRAESLEEDGGSVSEQGEGDCPVPPGRLQDEHKHPQLLLPPCWDERGSGEPGTQLPPIRERPPRLWRSLKRGLSHQLKSLVPFSPRSQACACAIPAAGSKPRRHCL